MDSDNPFSGVIDTLADSLLDHSSVSAHDILDAYATFANRIRFHGSCDASLTVLKTHKDSFIRALRRDVRLAHVDPLMTREMSPGITTATRQYARDSSSLCLHALCVLSTIFRFPAFHSVFSEHDLSTLLGDVLDITLADELPSLNEAKTYSFSFWTLSCHRLPEAILSSRRDDVFSALQRSLDSTRHPPAVILNGIKSISHTLEHYPCAFLHLLAPLLPNLMSNLRAESSDLRLHASIALGKFAHALVSNSDLSLTNWKYLSNHLIPFLESNCGDSKPDNTNFQHVVRTAFSVDSHAHPRHPPTWILAVLASLILLCGPTLYSKPIVLHFVLQSLALALTHKRSVIRALHPHVWRCFLSTFSRMLFERVDPALVSSAFYTIKQEVRGGIGTALANVLLSHRIPMVRPDERRDRVSRALSVIMAMTQTDCKHTRREGFMFLQAFTNDAQARHQITQDMCETPASILLDGAIVGAPWDGLPSIVHSIPKIPVEVHWLDEKEIAQHYRMLLDIWKIFATKVDKKDSDSSLVDVWLAILLACSHQLGCGEHVSITTEVLIQSAAMIAEFLPPVPSAEHQPDWGSWSVHDQLSRLAFIEQLWSAMRKAFITSSLSEAAELILASVLKYAFHVLDVDVRPLWGGLCANLMVTASPSFLRDARDRTASQTVIRDQRELWGVIATSLSSSEHGIEWEGLVKFLSIPICCWVLSKPELEVWEALFRNAILVSGSSAIAASTTMLYYFREKEAENWESIIPVLSFFLMYARGQDVFPTEELFSLLDFCLAASYSQARHSPETLTRSLGLLSMIRGLIVSTPDKVMRILQALRNSLCLWIEDHLEVMTTDEFNSVAVSLYCETLKTLEVLPLSIQSLQGMETFLASAFSRIPTPAIAPFAFEKFWRATYHGHNQFCNNLPPKIKSCLICFVAAYGGDLADGLSLTTESQSQSISGSSQARFPTSQQHGPDALHVEAVAPCERQEMFTGQEDTTFLLPSLDDDVHHPTALRRLQEYSSRIDASSQDEPERSTGGSQIRTPSDLATSDAVPRSHSRRTSRPVTTHVSNQKRKLVHSVDAPRKRSRTSREILRAVRKSESEPATRDVTPMDVPRTNSVPLREMVVFGGVQISTLRAITWRRKKARGAGTSQSRASLPPSTSSSEDSLDWEDYRVAPSSEVDVDQSLLDAQPSSPPPTQASTSRDTSERLSPYSIRTSGSDRAPDISPESSLAKATSQNEITPSAPPRPTLRRAKTTSARLDALQDVYSAVANGGSQIPMSELVHATRLVHQIGATLTEQMGKKMGGPK